MHGEWESKVLRVAYGKNVGSEIFVTKELTIEQIEAWFKHPKVEPENRAKYEKMSDAEKKALKDGPCYIIGKLRDGHRKKGDIEERDAVVLDLDHAVPDLAERLPELLPYRAIYHSTFSSTPAAPRLRVLLPLKRSVTSGEYKAVAAELGKMVGEQYVDPASYIPNQTMYFPHTLAEEQYIFGSYGENLVDPDAVLEQVVLAATEAQPKKTGRAQNGQDPTQLQQEYVKPMEQRAFDLAYAIVDAIKVFLPDIYSPTVNPDRYTYISGKCQNGLWIQDNMAYSFDETDSAHTGYRHDAYSLVKIHCFGKNKAAGEQMRKWVLKDSKVQAELAKLTQEAKDELGILGILEKDLYGRTMSNYNNIETIFTQDPVFADLAYDELSRTFCSRSPLLGRGCAGQLTNIDNANIRVYIGKEYGIVAPKIIDDVKTKVCYEKRFHPIQEYLQSLTWDGLPRLGRLLVDYLGAEPTEYVQKLTKMVLVAAVTRAFEPGAKFDYVLTLRGPSGIGKSTLFSKLGQKWYSGSLNGRDIADKKAPEKLQGIWIMEWQEMRGREKVSADDLKGFVTDADDRYREVYDVAATSHPRQGIIVATTNAKEDIVMDEDGNRRFLVVQVHGHAAKDPRFISQSEIDQYWAEAYTYYKEQSVQIYEDKQLEAMAAQEREPFVEYDPYVELLERTLCSVDKPIFISNLDLTMDVLGKKAKEIGPADLRRTSKMMEKVTVVKTKKKKKKIDGVSTLGFEITPLDEA